MAPLHRPYIPLEIRCQVAERQMREKNAVLAASVLYGQRHESDGKKLRVLLRCLFGDEKFELHHRPSLVNRRRYVRNGKVFYDPPANDPEHLVYLAEDDHDIETRIRGIGAQRSDLSQRRYNKRVAENRERKVTSVSGVKLRMAKRKWAGAPIRSANRWPPRGTQKIANRKTP